MASRSWVTLATNTTLWRVSKHCLCALILGFTLAACTPGGQWREPDSPYAPGVDTRKQAVPGVVVGNRLVQAGQYELALDAYNRAVLEDGMTAEILSGMGTANLGLGRLGQAETLLNRAIDKEEDWPETWNNLGVVLMEQGKTAEAEQVFRKAYALDNGKSDSIRDNLRLALAKNENSDITEIDNQDYKMVRRGSGDFLIRTKP
jgi:tetratricopeptide (TPR) repeat protein